MTGKGSVGKLVKRYKIDKLVYFEQYADVRDAIQREKNITMLYTSHNMRDVEEVCDRVLFMHKGRIIAEGTPQQVIEKFHQKNLEEVFIRVARSGDVLAAEESK